jgi:hypothetical protein
MAKIALAATCLMLVFSSVTNATTLQIQSGGGISHFSPPDLFWSFSGPGFSGSGLSLGSDAFGGFSMTGGGSLQTQVTVQSFAPCIPASLSQSCGSISFTYLAPFVNGTAPFSAAGHLNVGNNCDINLLDPPGCPGFDLVGYGVFTRFSDQDGAQGKFSFLVPEPSTLGLVGIGVLALPLLRRLKLKI